MDLNKQLVNCHWMFRATEARVFFHDWKESKSCRTRIVATLTQPLYITNKFNDFRPWNSILRIISYHYSNVAGATAPVPIQCSAIDHKPQEIHSSSLISLLLSNFACFELILCTVHSRPLRRMNHSNIQNDAWNSKYSVLVKIKQIYSRITLAMPPPLFLFSLTHFVPSCTKHWL